MPHDRSEPDRPGRLREAPLKRRRGQGTQALDASQARPGQRLVGLTGPRFLPLRVVFDFTEINAERHNIRMEGRLPFGLKVSKVSENLIITPVGSEQCRVNYNCNFELPGGLRGQLIWRLLRREFDRGPADSLERLKSEAERRVAISSSDTSLTYVRH